MGGGCCEVSGHLQAEARNHRETEVLGRFWDFGTTWDGLVPKQKPHQHWQGRSVLGLWDASKGNQEYPYGTSSLVLIDR